MYYKGIGYESGRIVYEEEAFDYALSEMSKQEEQEEYKQAFDTDFDASTFRNEEDRDAFVEWFFSGNWVREVDSSA